MDTNTKRGYDLINRRRKQWANEEEVRHAWMKGLEEALQIDLDADRAKRKIMPWASGARPSPAKLINYTLCD